jgi:hypothetical protein
MPDPVWSLSQHSLRVADQVYYRQLDDISVVGWSNGILTDVGQKPVMADRASREFYSDALFDLIRLLEEVRFEIAFAAMLAADYRARNPVDEPEVQHLDEDGTVIEMTLSIEILAVLSPSAPPPPSPSLLASDLHRDILGGRHLSRWLAGQLLDSAIVRAISALDRMATMLHVRAGLPVARFKDGTPKLPAFGTDTLRAMNFAYQGHHAWEDLRAVTRDDAYKFVRRYRNNNVHQRRWPSELHGEKTLSYWDAGAPHEDGPQPERRYEGLTAQESINLAIGTWNQILRPAIHAGGRLFADEEPSV